MMADMDIEIDMDRFVNRPRAYAVLHAWVAANSALLRLSASTRSIENGQIHLSFMQFTNDDNQHCNLTMV